MNHFDPNHAPFIIGQRLRAQPQYEENINNNGIVKFLTWSSANKLWQVTFEDNRVYDSALFEPYEVGRKYVRINSSESYIRTVEYVAFVDNKLYFRFEGIKENLYPAENYKEVAPPISPGEYLHFKGDPNAKLVVDTQFRNNTWRYKLEGESGWYWSGIKKCQGHCRIRVPEIGCKVLLPTKNISFPHSPMFCVTKHTKRTGCMPPHVTLCNNNTVLVSNILKICTLADIKVMGKCTCELCVGDYVQCDISDKAYHIKQIIDGATLYLCNDNIINKSLVYYISPEVIAKNIKTYCDCIAGMSHGDLLHWTTGNRLCHFLCMQGKLVRHCCGFAEVSQVTRVCYKDKIPAMYSAVSCGCDTYTETMQALEKTWRGRSVAFPENHPNVLSGKVQTDKTYAVTGITFDGQLMLSGLPICYPSDEVNLVTTRSDHFRVGQMVKIKNHANTKYYRHIRKIYWQTAADRTDNSGAWVAELCDFGIFDLNQLHAYSNINSQFCQCHQNCYVAFAQAHPEVISGRIRCDQAYKVRPHGPTGDIILENGLVVFEEDVLTCTPRTDRFEINDLVSIGYDRSKMHHIRKIYWQPEKKGRMINTGIYTIHPNWVALLCDGSVHPLKDLVGT